MTFGKLVTDLVLKILEAGWPLKLGKVEKTVLGAMRYFALPGKGQKYLKGSFSLTTGSVKPASMQNQPDLKGPEILCQLYFNEIN